MDFKDKVVVVTGAGRGIGRQIAQDFAEKGAKLALFDLDQESLQATQKQLSNLTECESFLVNITDWQALTCAIDKVIDKFLKIDILINNAGITKDGLALRLSEND